MGWDSWVRRKALNEGFGELFWDSEESSCMDAGKAVTNGVYKDK